MIVAILIGIAAGVLAGMLGVGGGILFVPALATFAGLTQLDAVSTSLLAIIPVALIGGARQYRYGNVRLRDGILLGLLAVGGAVLGSLLANLLPERVLVLSFAVLTLYFAYSMLRRGMRERRASQTRAATQSE